MCELMCEWLRFFQDHRVREDPRSHPRKEQREDIMTLFTVVGSLNYDLVSYSERVPEAGETFQGDSFETHIGGKGLNQTIALARMARAQKVRMVGSVGEDDFGKALNGALKENGVDSSGVTTVEGVSSGVAVIVVERATGENRILITSGANAHTTYSEDELSDLFKDVEDEVVVFQNEIPGTRPTIEWLYKHRPQTTIVYNPSPYYKFSSEILHMVDTLIVNEGEMLAIGKDSFTEEQYSKIVTKVQQEPIAAYQEMLHVFQAKLSPNKSQTLVITLGKSGSLYKTKDSEGRIYATEVKKVVDTTGAGDTFLGAFITQLSISNIQDALEFASRASSLAIQKNGASESIPTHDQVINS